jgi:hypothetical protein
MRFPHFWQHRRSDRWNESGEAAEWSRSWRDSGLADEVEAYLFGKTVDHLATRHRPVPAWAAVNRLAHGTRADLLRVAAGAVVEDHTVHPTIENRPWAAAERFVAGHLLALAPTEDELREVQATALVPLELDLIERTRVERLTTDRVLELGGEAVDSFHGQR